MANVKQLLQGKGHDVWSIGPEASVYDAIEMMADKDTTTLASGAGRPQAAIAMTNNC